MIYACKAIRLTSEEARFTVEADSEKAAELIATAEADCKSYLTVGLGKVEIEVEQA